MAHDLPILAGTGFTLVGIHHQVLWPEERSEQENKDQRGRTRTSVRCRGAPIPTGTLMKPYRKARVNNVMLTVRRWACSWSSTSSLWGIRLLLGHAGRTPWPRWGSSPLPSLGFLWFCTSRRDSAHLSAYTQKTTTFQSPNVHPSATGKRLTGMLEGY